MGSGEEFFVKVRLWSNEVAQELMNREWRIPPRPWSELFEKFTIPKRDARTIGSRMYLNLNYYQTNYVVMVAFTVIFFILRHRWSLFVVGTIIAGWVFATSMKPVIISGRKIRRKEKFYFMCVVTLVLPAITGVTRAFFMYFLVITSIICLHALFRHTNVRHKVTDIRQQVNDNW
ncbi:hypothetical protein NDN08_003596 [Rhodosorus marinus]|uniref:PRA1 family protein n=1 Tax=Rhodosorus marinus TaxID=101924 RepID=A0AAV8UX15_9RHOD|nr:hypothetical protein NDN08_003596 [Rhodosorus marinus]